MDCIGAGVVVAVVCSETGALLRLGKRIDDVDEKRASSSESKFEMVGCDFDMGAEVANDDKYDGTDDDSGGEVEVRDPAIDVPRLRS